MKAALLLAAGPAAAQAVGDCDGPAAGAQHVYAPFEATIRDFAGGAIRVTALDEGPDARGSSMMNRGAYHLTVTIRREDGAVSERRIEPHYLLLKYPVWYVVAVDHLRQAPRTFRCDRMIAASRTGDPFRLLPKPAFRSAMEGDDLAL